jgi:hypothetical protein
MRRKSGLDILAQQGNTTLCAQFNSRSARTWNFSIVRTKSNDKLAQK